MKNLFIAALLAVCLSSSAFATDENRVSMAVRDNFNEEFKDIDEVDWTVRETFVKATFTLKGKVVEAFYDRKGNKIGTSHHVALEELPLNARRTIAKKYSSYNIIEALEFKGVEENAFFISAEDENEKLILKIYESGTISVFKKTRKDKFW